MHREPAQLRGHGVDVGLHQGVVKGAPGDVDVVNRVRDGPGEVVHQHKVNAVLAEELAVPGERRTPGILGPKGLGSPRRSLVHEGPEHGATKVLGIGVGGTDALAAHGADAGV